MEGSLMIKLIIKTEKLPLLWRMLRIMVKIADRDPVKIKGCEEYVTEISNISTATVFFFDVYKNRQKHVVLFPQYSKTGVIECYCSYRIDILGMLTYGIFRSPLILDVEIGYK
jgi:hypothetical protein